MYVRYRGLTLFVLATLIGFLPAMNPQLASAAPTNPALKILSVLTPVPAGGEPGSQIFLQANVKANVGFGSSPQVSFYLAANPFHGPNDVPIGSTTVPLLSVLFAPGVVDLAANVPPGVPAGFYYVLACAGAKNCAATPGTIAIIDQRLSPVASPGITSLTPPAPEYFPESTSGMSVGAPFDCPISGHGQWPSRCVWVTTQQVPVDFRVFGLFYCPASNPYPYLVFFGFDTLWEERSEVGVHAATSGVSATKYKLDGDFPLSFGGDPRGYASFLFWCTNGSKGCNNATNGRAQYLCTNKKATSLLP